MDVTHWLGIDQRCIEMQRLAGPDSFHPQIADIEFQRRLTRFHCVDDEFCVRAYEAVDEDAHLSTTLSKFPHRLPIIFRGNIHDKTVHVNDVHVHRLAKQAAERGLKTEFPHLEQWLHAVFPPIWISSTENFQPLSIHMHAVRNPHVKLDKLNPALEASRQRLNHPCAQNRLCVRDHHTNANHHHREKYSDDRNNPAPWG